jgi:hypothetical protein
MIRNKKHLKTISAFLTLIFLSQILFPTAAYALTGGPSQPEVQSFEPIGTNQMVDPFTGDFTYNIPLMDVGGYPVNISYHSGITMDQEASWVGLGWNINPGVVNRNLRGLPDDFNGDEVTHEFNMKPNETIGLTLGAGYELFGKDFEKFNLPLNAGLGISYNNYNGIGMDITVGASLSMKFLKSNKEWGSANLGLNMTSSSNDGLTVSPSASFSVKANNIRNRNLELGGNIGVAVNSRQGLKGYSLGTSLNGERLKDGAAVAQGSSSFGSFISFTPNTYIPQQRFPFESSNFSGAFKLGTELGGHTFSGDLLGFASSQKLITHEIKAPAYGYLHTEKGQENDKALLDFNREKDGSFTRHKPNLPITNFTFDQFGISGQGIGGTFRAHRSDVGYIHDPLVINTSGSGNVGYELGIVGIGKIGLDSKTNHVTSSSGRWKNSNRASSNLKYQSSSPSSKLEPSYFKLTGEKTIDIGDPITKSQAWQDALLWEKPVNISLGGEGFGVYADSKYQYKDGSTSPMSQTSRISRAKRNQLISTLTNFEVERDMGTGDYVSSLASSSHIGEVSVLRNDGSRYIYGIPAYNYLQKEVSFNVSGNSGANCATGLIDYYDKDASKDNDKGIDNFFQSTSTPPYAHSYLMTALLSSDYSDFDGTKGPSDNDFGNWVKFEYDHIPSYKWRVPFLDHKASYNQGLKSSGSDDQGSYLYGEKELFYLDIIESKTHVAVFHTSDREDGYGVQNEHGGGLGSAMKKLDKISLYSKADYLENEGNLASATPIKEVHFEYDYSLCQGIPNNSQQTVIENGVDINADKGKLTLKKIYFTYGNSYKAKFSAYDFSYADLDHDGNIDANANPDYNLKSYDRWGHYKPNINTGCNYEAAITTAEYPYVDQDKTTADQYQAAWSLTDIALPSGGTIEVNYESDDYAYVQDKKAMQMFQVVGAGVGTDFIAFSNKSELLYDGKTPQEYLYFKLQDPLPFGTETSVLKSQYIGDIEDNRLYFRFLMDLADDSHDGDFDYVSGYAELDGSDTYGFVNSGASQYEYGYVRLKPVKKGDKKTNATDAHPISRAAWNFARIHNPELAFSIGDKNRRANPSKIKLEDVFFELGDAFKGFAEIFNGPNGQLRSKKYGQRFEIGKSWIRLYHPNGKKLGGGVRVQSLVMKDAWDSMTANGSPSQYGQEYSYVTEEGQSSGVAAYEPLAGGDENPFRQPILFDEEVDAALVPDQEHYMEQPLGESYFPAPSVGYSRVVIKNLQHTDVTQHATGRVVHEFYTAKDFPTHVDFTPIKIKHEAPTFGDQLLKIDVKEHMNASQGYAIETNDMHGKPKAQWVYAEGANSYQSGVEYKYKTKTIDVDLATAVTTNPKRKVLDNDVQVFFDDNTVSTKELGVEYEMVNDFRMSKTKSESSGLDLNTDGILAALLPIPIPTVYPSLSKTELQYKGVVTTKVVNRYAIQDETIAYDNNSIIRTKNLLWDAETGEVILSKVENDFDDEVYNFSYPAHLIYDKMGSAYQNIGYERDVTVANHTYQGFNYEGYTGLTSDGAVIQSGDELMLIESNSGTVSKAWAWAPGTTNDVENTYIYFIDKYGDGINSGTYTAKVIRSAYRNMPSASIGQLTTKQNPIVNDALAADQTTEVLSASAVEFSEEWQIKPVIIDAETGSPFVSIKKCENFTPDVTADLKTAITRFIEALRASDKLDRSQATQNEITNYGYIKNFTLASLVGFGNFSSSDLATLKSSFTANTPIPGTVNVELSAHLSSRVVGYLLSSIVYNLHFTNSDGSLNRSGRFIVQITGTGSLNGGSISKVLSINTSELSSLLTPNCTRTIGGSPTTTPYVFDPTFDFTVKPFSTENGGGQQTQAGLGSLSLPFVNGRRVEAISCPITPVAPLASSVNPYVTNVRGNWRPKNSYAYLGDRTYSTNVDLQNDAEYSTFDPYWDYDNGPSAMFFEYNAAGTSMDQWTTASTITKIDENGNEVENQDALGIYSAALFEPGGNFVLAVAGNSQHGQLAYDGFEHYDGIVPVCPEHEYFGIGKKLDDATYSLSTAESHTGKNSLIIPAESSVVYEVDYNTAVSAAGYNDMPYTLKESDLLGSFGQYESSNTEEFLVSYWIKEDNTDILNDFAGITLSSGTFTIGSSITKSKVIEGWQKIDQYFTIPTGNGLAADLTFTNGSLNNYYIDDIRIQRLQSSLKSFVYDYKTMRFIAELDENNFATYYEYDEEGALVRVKKETERGIQTIQENRNHSARP